MIMQKGVIVGNNYELIEQIGKGGMSEVWKALHIHLDMIVAVKLLHKELADTKEFVARFKQEAQIASKLDHDNICSVSDYGHTKEQIPFIVMKYLEGENLLELLRRIIRVPVGASLSIIKQVLSGLQAAHSMGVIHRDIKPGNIFIARKEGEAATVKILDFGISKIRSQSKRDLWLTSTDIVLGTAYYLSPEQIRESKNVDHRTDIYAAGAVLYRLITGKAPFLGATFKEVTMKALNDPLVYPGSLMKDLDDSVSRVMERAMVKEPQERYQSADEMIQAIDNCLGEYAVGGIDSINIQPPRFGKKTIFSAIAIFLFVLLGASALVVTLTGNFHGGDAGAMAVPPESGPARAVVVAPASKNFPFQGKAGKRPASSTSSPGVGSGSLKPDIEATNLESHPVPGSGTFSKKGSGKDNPARTGASSGESDIPAKGKPGASPMAAISPKKKIDTGVGSTPEKKDKKHPLEAKGETPPGNINFVREFPRGE